MNDDQIDDLKQFIATTVSQALSGTEQRLDKLDGRIDGLENRIGKLDGRMSRLESKLEDMHQEMVDGFAGVGEAIERIHDRLDGHDTQIVQLQIKTGAL